MRLVDADDPVFDSMRFGIIHLFLLFINFLNNFQLVPLFIRQSAEILDEELIDSFQISFHISQLLANGATKALGLGFLDFTKFKKSFCAFFL
jgi:hypothetical protein